LIVDGDPTSRAELRELVAPMARVLEVGSGEEALGIAASHELAAILIDVDLPDCDGFQTVTRLRLDPHTRNVPVLFLSHAVPEWFCEQRGYELGALGYLRKPVDGTALHAKLDVLLKLYQRGVELRRKTEEAQAKDIYMGVLGHDLRTPLSAILMSARILLMQGELGAKDRNMVARMARNAERMAGLIRDILDYTRGQAVGGLPVMPRATDMGDICSTVIEELALLHSDRFIRFSRTGELKGTWDRERVEQVVSNLLGNALEHGVGDIQVTAEGGEHAVIIRVHNRGASIPTEQIPSLFEPFRRGTSSRFGLGLGLYIVREIMRAHGGTVEVTSTAEAGTTFITRWPRSPG
jgi:signal transduction histidine kinase